VEKNQGTPEKENMVNPPETLTCTALYSFFIFAKNFA
jgi:hypothetical protein